MSRAVRSYCRQCLAVCGLIVTVEGDEIVAVRGDPDHPVTHGYTCAKGRAMGAMHHAPDRLDEPLIRRGDRLVPVSWDELLDDLAEGLSRIADESGPDAIGTYFGSLSGWDPAGRATSEAFHRALGSKSRYTSTTTDCPAKPLVAQAVLGHAAITPLPDLESCSLLLLIGTNPVVSHGHACALTVVAVSRDNAGGLGCRRGVPAPLGEAGTGSDKSKPPQPGPPSRRELPRRFGQYPCVAMADEIEDGHLRALISLAGNPVLAFADSGRVADAFRALDILAVADVRHNATVELATHVLPCTGPFERADVTSGVELYQPIVAGQFVPAVVPPGAGRRPLWWIIGQLGRRLGHGVLPGSLDVDDPAVDDDAVLDALVGRDRVLALRDTPSGITAPIPRFGWLLGS